MGTVKYTGPVASFHCPTNAEIRSLKVHFSPKQDGTGDPSPENVRPIVGWDGVKAYDWTSANASTSSVPSEYKKVEYLECTGTQYIATNYIVQSGWADITMRFMHRATQSNDSMYFGSSAGSTKWTFQCECYAGTGWYVACGKYNYRNQLYGFCTSSDVVYDLRVNNVCLTIGGNTTTDKTIRDGENTFPMYIFAWNGSGNAQYLNTGARIYFLTFRENGIIAADFVPCLRKSDNKPGMYDTVSQTFYTNAGTGEFLYGPEVSGYTEDYKFGVLGKNKLDVSAYIDNEYVKSDGTFDTNNSFRRTDYLHLSPGDYIYSSVKNDSVAAYSRVCGYTKDKTFVSMLNEQLKNSENYTMTFTVADNVYYIVLQSYKNTSQEQIELGSTATTYEPYSSDNTVYGGYVDLAKGEVVAEWYKVVMDGVNIKCNSDYSNDNYIIGGWVYVSPTGMYDSEFHSKYCCDSMPIVANTETNPQSLPFMRTTGAGYLYLRIWAANTADHPELDTAQKRKDFVNAYLQEHPASVVYKLREPIHYPLAPTALQTFLGRNNVWSNADYVEVEYDLHETQDLLQRKAFIMANQPHIVKPAAATLQSFRTDVIAPLKECKVHFEPVQEGSGDPSPDNVRPITGWTGCEVYRTGKNLLNASVLSQAESYSTLGLYGYRYTDAIFLKPNTQYYINWDRTGQDATADPVCYWGIKIYNSTYSDVSDTGTFRYYVNGANGLRRYTTSFTTGPYGAVRFAINPQSGYANMQAALNDVFAKAYWQMEIGTAATSYEPYNGTTIPFDWTSSAGTVYGGYVDLVKGELVATHRKVQIPPNDIKGGVGGFVDNPAYQGATFTHRYFSISQQSNTNGLLIGNYMSKGNCGREAWRCNYDGTGLLHYSVSNDAIGVTSETSAGDRNTAVAAWLSEYNPYLIYTLQTPQLVATLTPTQLKTLRGTNNVWSNANGNIELAYWSH